MYSRQFWASTTERVLWTFLQALAAAGASDGVLDLTQMSWPAALGIAGGAALVSLVKCLGAALVAPQGTPATLAPDLAALPDTTPHYVRFDDDTDDGRHRRRDP